MPARWAACALVLAGALWGVACLFFPECAGHLRALEGRLVLFGGLSSVAAAMALTSWVVNGLQVRLKKRGSEDLGLTRRWARFLRAYHTALGWLALATATAHALYLASASFDLSAHAVTGWVALGALVALVAAGVPLNRASRAKSKPKEAEKARAHRRDYRRAHGTLAALFVFSLSLHAGFPVVVLGVWALLAISTVLVWQRTRTRHSMKEQRTIRGSARKEATGGAAPAGRAR